MNLREMVKAAIAFADNTAIAEGLFATQVWVYCETSIEPDLRWPVYVLATDEYAETAEWLSGNNGKIGG